jgi:hypothetical protein
MSDRVERFDPEFDSDAEIPNGQSIVMEPFHEGDWVRYSDYEKEIQRRQDDFRQQQEKRLKAEAERDQALQAHEKAVRDAWRMEIERDRARTNAADARLALAEYREGLVSEEAKLEAARALCPDGAHWEDFRERYEADASAALQAALQAIPIPEGAECNGRGLISPQREGNGPIFTRCPGCPACHSRGREIPHPEDSRRWEGWRGPLAALLGALRKRKPLCFNGNVLVAFTADVPNIDLWKAQAEMVLDADDLAALDALLSQPGGAIPIPGEGEDRG